MKPQLSCRQYAETGKYDIIFAQASFTEQIKPLMEEYPEILWVVAGSGNEQLGGNLYNIYMRIHEPSYSGRCDCRDDDQDQCHWCFGAVPGR